MKPPIKIEVGTKVRDWIVGERDKSKKKGRHYFCQCKCGRILSKPIGDLIRVGPQSCKSCACKRREFGKLGIYKPLELSGGKFGKWKVLERIYNGKIGTYWKCQCDCGNISDIFGPDLKRGRTTQCKECACRKKATTHGFATKGKITPEYRCWAALKSRCLNPNDKRFKDWGGRGIKVCNEWVQSFEVFLAYVGKKPSPRHSIDRINNEGNYEPGNIRWATPKQQANNKRNTAIRIGKNDRNPI